MSAASGPRPKRKRALKDTTARQVGAVLRLNRARVRRFNRAALRTFVRFVPTEQQSVYGLTLLIGVVCGFAAVAFHLAIRFAETHLFGKALTSPGWTWIPLTVLTPVLGGMVAGVLLTYVVPKARGSGVPQVKVAFAVRGGRLRFRDAVGKFIVSVIQIGSGASLGREGPTVQICATLASTLGRFPALSRESFIRLIPVGAAAGIAAAFNAPIAAVTFTIEEVVGDLDQAVLSGVVVAAALAAAIERSVLGEHPVFQIPSGFGLHHASSLIFYALLGVAAAGVSVLFSESLLKLRARFRASQGIPQWLQPAVGGLVTGVLAVVAAGWLGAGKAMSGGGYDMLSEALSGHLGIQVLLALCAFKVVATVFCYSSGGAGGIFAPVLFIGAMLGGAMGIVDTAVLEHGHEEIGAFALTGMGAVFAGVIRAPITSVLIIFEMTGAYSLILPLMLANMTAYGLARHWRSTPIYEALLEQDGIHLPGRGKGMKHALEQLQVGAAMTVGTVTLKADLTTARALDQVQQIGFSTFPVVNGRGVYVGLVSEGRLRRALAQGDGETPVGDVVETKDHVYSDHPLIRAVVRMNQTGTRHLVVLNRTTNRVVGILTMADVVRAEANAAVASGGDWATSTTDLPIIQSNPSLPPVR